MILKAHNISKKFGKRDVLREVSLELDKGKMYGIVGENGSGKSTLLKIIVGEWQADKGSIEISGKFGYCPQQSTLFQDLTVDENFRIFGLAYGMGDNLIREISMEMMLKFNFSKFNNERIGNLSGGTQQKLNLCIALMNKPNLLILDEPYNGFDWETYSLFWNISAQLIAEGSTILIVAHLLNEKSQFGKIFKLNYGILE